AAASSDSTREFIDAARSGSTGRWAPAANASTRAPFYKDQLLTIMKDMLSMGPVREAVEQIWLKLNSSSNSVVGDGLDDAAALVADYADRAGDWLTPFADSIRGAAEMWLDKSVDMDYVFECGVGDVSDSAGVETKQEIAREVQRGLLLKTSTEARVTAKFEAALLDFDEVLRSGAAPSAQKVKTFDSVLSRRGASEHSCNSESQNVFMTCTMKTAALKEVSLDLSWHEVIGLLVEASTFYYGADLAHVREMVQAVMAALTDVQSVKNATEYCDADDWGPTWKTFAEIVLRYRFGLGKLLRALRCPASPG
ncbi:unnamed protein product, partial [Prorocentrum cordatum]